MTFVSGCTTVHSTARLSRITTGLPASDLTIVAARYRSLTELVCATALSTSRRAAGWRAGWATTITVRIRTRDRIPIRAIVLSLGEHTVLVGHGRFGRAHTELFDGRPTPDQPPGIRYFTHRIHVHARSIKGGLEVSEHRRRHTTQLSSE